MKKKATLRRSPQSRKRVGLGAVALFFILFSAIPPPPPAGTEPGRALFAEGRFSIAGLPETRQYPTDQLVGPNWSAENRVTRKGTYKTFTGEMKKKLAFEKLLSQTVKESQYHTLVKKESFTSPSQIEGIRCLFGYAPHAVCRLSYFFLNRQNDLVELRIRFPAATSPSNVSTLDKIIVNSLCLE